MGAVCCRPENIDFEGDVNLFHFVLLRSVGKGAFGKVRVVQHKQTRELYALKYINKAKCVKMKAVANIIQERRLLEEIDHPFVVNLRYAFQDDENCFFVLDLMLGGDLRFHLERLGSLSEETVRFYIAELGSALLFLHDKKIIHRDLKPDNILLDERGHAHLTDLNIAVHYSERRSLTGVAGSMAYMAPEILAKKGYSYQIDWWSLGVCAYELVYGRRPFRGKTNADLTHAIMRDPVRFPEDSGENTGSAHGHGGRDSTAVRDSVKCSKDGRVALRDLLTRTVDQRLGCRGGGGEAAARDFRKHPWFACIDWDTLESKELPSPFVPDSKKANFDSTHELEELLLEDNPLKARKRKANQDINNLSAEMRQMEEQFTVYDFKKMHRRSYYPNTNQQIATQMTATSSMGGYAASRPVTPNGDLNVADNIELNQRSDGESDRFHSLDFNGVGVALGPGGQVGVARMSREKEETASVGMGSLAYPHTRISEGRDGAARGKTAALPADPRQLNNLLSEKDYIS